MKNIFIKKNVQKIDEFNWQREIVNEFFDEDYYLKSYSDLISNGEDPLSHYLNVGWKQKLNPSPFFNTDMYLKSNPDVEREVVNPLVHYVMTGQNESRKLFPFDIDQIPEINIQALNKICRCNVEGPIKRPEEFSDYESNVFNVLMENIDWDFIFPIINDAQKCSIVFRYIFDSNFISPTPKFDTRFYLSQYQDIANTNIHPFYHYCVEGKKEGRLPVEPIFPVIETILNAKSVAEKTKHWIGKYESASLVTAKQLKQLFAYKSNKKVILSLTHDNYIDNVGGVQTCVQRESLLAKKKDISYLNIFPVRPRFEYISNGVVGLVLDNCFLGVCTTDSLLCFLKKPWFKGFRKFTIAHTLQGHDSDFVIKLLEISEKKFVWFHDYFLICEGFNLARNDAFFCGAPKSSSNACAICINGPKRERHLQISRQIISKADKILFPSQVAQEISLKAFPEIEKISRIVPHIKINQFHVNTTSEKKPLRVAFLGGEGYHKGFHLYEDLIGRFGDNDFICFYHFSAHKSSHRENLHHISVSVTLETPNAMVDAIRQEQIDVVLILSVWPETFNLTTYEALIAGSIVWTLKSSGNPARMIALENLGCCFETLDELHEALHDYAAGEARFRVSMEDSVGFSEMSFEVLNDESMG